MLSTRFVSGIPDISKTDAGVKPEEHDERKGNMAEDGPEHLAVVGVPHVEAVWRLVWEGVEDPHAHVSDDEEHDDLSARLRAPQLPGVAAAAQGVHDERCLDDDLEKLRREKFELVSVTFVIIHLQA